jgi:hypothetical protein
MADVLSGAGTFPFLRLPTEIRLEIYGHLLGTGSPSSDEVATYFNEKIARCPSIEPEILRVCKQCYIEAMPGLYEKRRFLVNFKGDLDNFGKIFLPMISPKAASMIRYFHADTISLRVGDRYWCDSSIEYLRVVLDMCPGLEVVSFITKGIGDATTNETEYENGRAIVISDNLLGETGHANLRRLVQYTRLEDLDARSKYFRMWALISGNDHLGGNWKMDDCCVS